MGALPSPPHKGSRLLETKFHPPATRRGHVARPRLVQQLLLSPARLTVVSAPPGFGKTTLLGEWLESIPAGSAAWLSLDPSDDSPSIFWAYVIEALTRVWPWVAESNARELIDSSPPPPIETVLRLVINTPPPDTKPVWLILDDFHVIEDSAIQQAIGFLVEHAPSHLRVVLASRVDPAFPLAKLRSRGELTEIRAADLRLTLAEATELLNGQAGLGIGHHDLEALESRTEGWAAALQLITLTLRGHRDPGGFIREFTGNDRYVVDYLVEEVLQRQDRAMREFLLRTSVLDQFTAALCDAVLPSTGSRRMIDAAERGNLFIVPLDGSRNWFRYHHLFADVLRAQLAEAYPGEVASLHHRASAWYSSNGQGSEVRWFEAPSCYVFHTLNAFEEGDEVVLDACRMPTVNMGALDSTVAPTPESKKLMEDSDQALFRWRFNTKTGAVKETQLDDQVSEFPRVNDGLAGYQAPFGYAARFGSDSGMPEADAIIKYDLQTGTNRVHLHGPNRFGGEGVFVPRPGATSEDDGWVVTYVYDGNTGGSEFVVIDALNMEAAPLARVPLPQRVPYGFHGAWISEERIANQR